MAEEAVGAVTTTVEAAPTTTSAATVGGQVDAAAGGQGDGVVETPAPLDPGYIARTKHLNFSEAELRSVPQDLVERMIAGSDRQLIDNYKREQTQGNYVPPVQNTRQQNGRFAPAAAATPEPTGDFAFDPLDLKFDGDVDADSPLVKGTLGLKDWTAKQLEKVHKHYEAKLAEFSEYRDHQIRQQNNVTIDRFLESQNAPEWESVFGKGATGELDTQSQEFLNRAEVWTAANAMVQQAAAQGRRITLNEALPRARNAMFMEKAFAIERAKTNEKRTTLEAGAAERPRTPGGVPVPQSIKERARSLREAAIRA